MENMVQVPQCYKKTKTTIPWVLEYISCSTARMCALNLTYFRAFENHLFYFEYVSRFSIMSN